jgi:ribosome maturation factor RimP
MATLNSEITSLIEPVCSAHGVELVSICLVSEKGRNILRAIIDRAPGAGGSGDAGDGSGVTLDDCTKVSRDLSTVLDVHEELLPTKYALEVSSPGLDRPLTKLSHYQRFVGREVKLELDSPLDGRRRFNGEILSVEGEDIRINQDGTPVTLPFGRITKSRLVYRF